MSHKKDARLQWVNKLIEYARYITHLDESVFYTVLGALSLIGKKASEYDQGIPQSHTADQPTVP